MASTHVVRRALEFGGGRYSTPTFLDQAIFGFLRDLTTLENDPEWLGMIEKMNSDGRHRVVGVDGKIADNVHAKLFAGCDLVLVDDSTNAADRAATIVETVKHLPATCLLVVHDFEIPVYRQGVGELGSCDVCDALIPATGVLSRNRVVNRRWFRQVNALIRKRSRDIPVNDSEAWREAFRSL